MEITVSKLNDYIKRIFQTEPMLNNISVKGEASNVKYHVSSGHIYFTLKDDKSQIACVMFFGNRSGLKFKLEDGQKIVVTGSVAVYERDGKYQIYAKNIDKAGIGDLYEKFEQLKKKLEQQGLFDDTHKKSIPMYSTRIGVVTSQGAAGLQDIIRVSKSRNPYVQLYLCPVLVQGEQAAASIAKGIKQMDEFGVDVIIVARGGGSIEDLWAFNEEIVAYACYECNTPIISGVGHETDTTIIDFVADKRTPTPSAAAQAAVFEYEKFIEDLDKYKNYFDSIMCTKLQRVKAQFENYKLRIEHNSPSSRLDNYRQHLDDLDDKLKSIINNEILVTRNKLSIYATRLEGLSPIKKLGQGYSYTEKIDGTNVKSVNELKKDDEIIINVTDGKIYAKIDKICSNL